MPTLAFPTLPSGRLPRIEYWGYDANTSAHVSPFTKDAETIELGGLRFVCTFGFEELVERDGGIFWAWALSLRGMAGRFTMPYWPRRKPLGAVSGTPVVAGAGQVGTSLAVSGMPTSRTVFVEGDALSVNGRLNFINAPVVSNGSGLATLTLGRPIYSAPANGAAIVWDTPVATWRLTEDSVRFLHRAQRRPPATFSLSAIEV